MGAQQAREAAARRSGRQILKLSVDEHRPRAQATWQGVDEFKASVQESAEKIGVSTRRIQVQRMRSKWASCSPTGTRSVPSCSMNSGFRGSGDHSRADPPIAPNHGRLFRSLYSSFFPAWREIVGDRAVCGAFRG
jgi:hypothetical protein